MANIIVTLDHPVENGEEIKFQAPCDCTEIIALTVNHPKDTEGVITEANTEFTFKDAHGAALSLIGNLFTSGAIVKVILDTVNNAAYIQNADTNSYIESRWPHLVTITLPANGWTDNKQSIAVIGVLADETAQMITPTPALASQTAYYEAGIKCVGQAENTLTFAADTVPSADLSIYVIIQEVSV